MRRWPPWNEARALEGRVLELDREQVSSVHPVPDAHRLGRGLVLGEVRRRELRAVPELTRLKTTSSPPAGGA